MEWRGDRCSTCRSIPAIHLTPFTAATEDAGRLSRSEAPTLPRIPVLPISHEDALPLLSALEGPVAPPHWRGALPITYHLGPGPATVRLKLEFNWDLVPAYNVIAKLGRSRRTGSVDPPRKPS